MVATQKYQAVGQLLAKPAGVLVAFSGGIDSTLVLKAALAANSRVLAVTATSALRSQAETELAQELAGVLGARHILIEATELQNDAFRKNPKDRCYLCKSLLCQQLKTIAIANDLELIVDGTNADDLTVYRPGVQALTEAGVVSPLAVVGLSKAEIRFLAQDLGLPNWDRPSNPCLATRFPYGTLLTEADLARVDRGEAALRQLSFSQLRLRCHGDLARLELPVTELSRALELREIIVKTLVEQGFRWVSLDLAGFSSGSWD